MTNNHQNNLGSYITFVTFIYFVPVQHTLSVEWLHQIKDIERLFVKFIESKWESFVLIRKCKTLAENVHRQEIFINIFDW